LFYSGIDVREESAGKSMKFDGYIRNGTFNPNVGQRVLGQRSGIIVYINCVAYLLYKGDALTIAEHKDKVLDCTSYDFWFLDGHHRTRAMIKKY
jgi:hypothetical protein